jgi:pimeloyl-ACP methyl ester carboxylesterase
MIPAPHAALLAGIPVREHELNILGSRTRYWEYGPADARHTVVIAHGYRGDHHGLEPVIARLPEVRFIGPDLPGFGDSTPLTEAPHSIGGYGRWLGELLTALGISGDAVLLGHSFGSIVTTHAVVEGLAPPGLILVNPIASDPHRVAGSRATRAFYAVGRRFPERFARGWLGNWLIVRFMSMALAKTPDRDLRRWIHEEHHRYFNRFADAATVAEAFDASLTDITRVAPRIDVPVLMIAGEIDRIAPLEGQRSTVGLFPDAELVVLPSVGHLIHYEAADGAATAIRAFLRDRVPGDRMTGDRLP